MLTARTDSKVLGYLGRALSLELSAVQLYSTQARLVSLWGLSDAAERLQAEAVSELSHADRIIARMLANGVAPNASQLRPVRLGNSLDELLEINMQFEQQLINLYSAGVDHCSQVADFDNRMLFAGLLKEEQEHLNELAEWRSRLRGGSTIWQERPAVQKPGHRNPRTFLR